MDVRLANFTADFSSPNAATEGYLQGWLRDDLQVAPGVGTARHVSAATVRRKGG